MRPRLCGTALNRPLFWGLSSRSLVGLQESGAIGRVGIRLTWAAYMLAITRFACRCLGVPGAGIAGRVAWCVLNVSIV